MSLLFTCDAAQPQKSYADDGNSGPRKQAPTCLFAKFLSKVVHVVHTWYKIYFIEQKLNNDHTRELTGYTQVYYTDHQMKVR